MVGLHGLLMYNQLSPGNGCQADPHEVLCLFLCLNVGCALCAQADWGQVLLAVYKPCRNMRTCVCITLYALTAIIRGLSTAASQIAQRQADKHLE